MQQKKASAPEINPNRSELTSSNSALGKGALLRTTTYSPGTTVPAPPLSTAPGSVLKSPPRKTERSGTALDDSLFALLDDLTEIVKAGGGTSPRGEDVRALYPFSIA